MPRANFRDMTEADRRAVARKGGIAAHQRGTARQWSPEEAREAGRKGGLVAQMRRRERLTQIAEAQ